MCLFKGAILEREIIYNLFVYILPSNETSNINPVKTKIKFEEEHGTQEQEY